VEPSPSVLQDTFYTVVCQTFTHGSEDIIVIILKVGELAKQAIGEKQTSLLAGFFGPEDAGSTFL
jgi:hypothetical protein